jgi:site-specific recombinase XerD
MEIRNNLEEFSKEITRKGYRPQSVKNYVSCVANFLEHFKDKPQPKAVNEQDIKNYLAQYTEHNTQRAHHAAVKCFYKYVIRQPEKFKFIEYCKRSRKLPVVMSTDEIQRLFNACGTHLVESGTDINLIQRLAGHQNVRTTNLYIQTSHTLISKIKSPLSAISV